MAEFFRLFYGLWRRYWHCLYHVSLLHLPTHCGLDFYGPYRIVACTCGKWFYDSRTRDKAHSHQSGSTNPG